MNFIKQISILLVIVTFFSCKTEKKDNSMTNEAIKKSDMNLSIKPGDNFYQYSNGGWIKNNPVPNDKTRYGSFGILYDNNQIKLKSLIDGLIKGNEEKNEEAKKITNIFKTGMDTVAIDKTGFEPIKSELADIENIKSKEELMQYVAKMHTHNNFPLFNIGASQDDKNSSMVILHINQGGINLPDRDYYTENDERTKKIRDDYTNLIFKLFSLIGDNNKIAKEKSEKILKFETSLAKNSLTRLELRDPFTTYNKMSVSDLQKLSPAIKWKEYFSNIKLKNLEELNVRTTNFFKKLSDVLNKTDLKTLKTYLSWNTIINSAPYLSSNFEKATFNFYGKSLSGQKEMRPRWKRVLGVTNGILGEAVGKLYVEKYFPKEAKERMLKLVENLRTAFSERIKK